ncbi:putative WRKY transcription factor 4 [Drosera capensis]
MEDESISSNPSSSKSSKHQLPTISIPPRGAADALFTGAKSPGPLTILSNFFSDYLTDTAGGVETRSFSQLLAGAMASPAGGEWSLFLDDNDSGDVGGVYGGGVYGCGDGDDSVGEKAGLSGFKRNRPENLMVPVSTLLASAAAAAAPSPASAAFTPTAFLNSPGMFSPSLSPFGMSHQQALAQVTAQAAMNQAAGYHAPSSLPASIEPLIVATLQSSAFDPHFSSIKGEVLDPVMPSQPDTAGVQNPSLAVDKPVNDGYNWRKYGQKHVKGSQYPRGYYRCTSRGCLVKKKVERSLDGHITEIIYKGQHSHDPPRQGKKGRESEDGNTEAIAQQCDSQWSSLGRDEESMQASSILLNGPSDSEESGEGNQKVPEDEDIEPNPKRMNIEAGTLEVALSHKTVTEPKIILETRSEVDLLDDGYRWRKYGQKVVKGNPNPRSYYKCTTTSCNVRKHIERSHTDPKSVITTYEGKHNHDIPAARGIRNIGAVPPSKLQPISREESRRR